MSKIKFDKEQSFFERKGFYIALAICLIAVGAASYAAVSGSKDNIRDEDKTSSIYSIVSEVGKNVSGMPYPESEAEESSFAESSTPSSDGEEKESTDKSSSPAHADFFVMPITGEILKDFSEDDLQYSETYKDWRLHTGTDIAGDAGSPVYSAGSGEVKEVYYDELYGTTVIIDHFSGITAKYCGLNTEPTVKEGDSVDPGTQIGVLAGVPCESVEQIHLHLEISVDGKAVSPSGFIKQSGLIN